ncbi:prepilin peptidase [Micromonospora sp. NPDC050397]|uniref:prepilin peptidase n=1 Tax=Micromonospora sp. NPDC050397 TaxID=3364279 RepID=UPI00384BA407
MSAGSVVTVLATVLGAVVGVNTPWLVHRLSVGPGSAPRSACERCTRPFPRGRPGWVRPDARCPGCGARLGPRTGPVVALGAAAFALVAAALSTPDGIDPALPAVLALVAVGLPLALIDLACLRLPDPLLAVATVLVLVGLVGASVLLGTPEPLLRALLAALVSAAGYLLLALLPGSRLGFGDVKLATLLGLPLGWFGWPVLLLGLALPHLVNGTIALVLLLTRRADRGSTWAFGPALLGGALLALVLG